MGKQYEKCSFLYGLILSEATNAFWASDWMESEIGAQKPGRIIHEDDLTEWELPSDSYIQSLPWKEEVLWIYFNQCKNTNNPSWDRSGSKYWLRWLYIAEQEIAQHRMNQRLDNLASIFTQIHKDIIHGYIHSQQEMKQWHAMKRPIFLSPGEC